MGKFQFEGGSIGLSAALEGQYRSRELNISPYCPIQVLGQLCHHHPPYSPPSNALTPPLAPTHLLILHHEHILQSLGVEGDLPHTPDIQQHDLTSPQDGAFPQDVPFCSSAACEEDITATITCATLMEQLSPCRLVASGRKCSFPQWGMGS